MEHAATLVRELREKVASLERSLEEARREGDRDLADMRRFQAKYIEADQRAEAAEASLGALRGALGMDTTTPVHDLLDALADAADHLLHGHDCDLHGWEGVGRRAVMARERAADIRRALAAPQPAATAPPIESHHGLDPGAGYLAQAEAFEAAAGVAATLWDPEQTLRGMARVLRQKAAAAAPAAASTGPGPDCADPMHNRFRALLAPQPAATAPCGSVYPGPVLGERPVCDRAAGHPGLHSRITGESWVAAPAPAAASTDKENGHA